MCYVTPGKSSFEIWSALEIRRAIACGKPVE
ncbi:hypothetical protein SM11_chr3837 [Sinorhizobium meliloti SM11]|uniref:Uncharacterized protein n=1 Tax=Sinorhizobium meliloti (strain SM11) TaxID=707241 RepID=F7X599_SINMM|nr:hypothetical protein SM11_chr3837 [Sinorhizobium meliloti SM11]